MYAYPKVEYLIRMYHISNSPELPEDYPEWQRQLVIESAIGSIQAADDMQHELFMILDLLESEGIITEWQNSKNG